MGGRGGSSSFSASNESSRERAEGVLKAMRDAGMKPTKSVEETQKILAKYDAESKKRDKIYQDKVKQIQKDRAKKAAEQKKYKSQNDQVRKVMNDASKLATAGDYKGAQKLIKQADKLNDAIPFQNRNWNTKLTPKKLDWRDVLNS